MGILAKMILDIFRSGWATIVCSADFSVCIVTKASGWTIRSRILIKTSAPSLTAYMTRRLIRRQLRYVSGITSSLRNVCSSIKLASCSFDFDIPVSFEDFRAGCSLLSRLNQYYNATRLGHLKLCWVFFDSRSCFVVRFFYLAYVLRYPYLWGLKFLLQKLQLK